MERNDQQKNLLLVFVFAFCVLQPLMDVISFFLLEYGLSTWPTMLLRTAVLAAVTLYGFWLTPQKRRYGNVLLLLAAFSLAHIRACMQVGYGAPISDLGNYLRIFLMPLTVLAFVTFLRADRRVFPTLLTALVCNFGIIVLVVFLSTVTGTDPHTYDSGNGICGWFYTGNSQSAILSMLAPIVICWGVQRWQDRLVPFALMTLAALGLLFLFGTRLAYAAIAAIGICLCLGLLFLDFRRYRIHACIVMVVAVALLLAYPVSPMRAQQASHGNVVQTQQARLDDLYAETYAQAQSDGYYDWVAQDAAYEAVYQEFAPELTGRFGITAIRQAYNDSLDYATISSIRDQKLLFGDLLMAESPLATHLFGLELGRFTYGEANFDVENDFHGIYYLCGWVGLGLMLLFFGGFILAMLRSLFRDFRKKLTLPILALAVAFCCGLVHAVFTAAVLRRNNASVYLGLVMACAWYLLVPPKPATRKRKELQS